MHRLLRAIKFLSAAAFILHILQLLCQAQLPVSLPGRTAGPRQPRQRHQGASDTSTPSPLTTSRGRVFTPLANSHAPFVLGSFQFEVSNIQVHLQVQQQLPRFGSCCHLPVIPIQKKAYRITTVCLLHLGVHFLQMLRSTHIPYPLPKDNHPGDCRN